MFNVGDYVIGENKVYHQRGKISRIEKCSWSRSGYIYKVGINWFFYGELKPWYDGMMSEIIGKDDDYIPERIITIHLGGTTYKVEAIRFSSVTNCCYIKVDKEDGTTMIDNENRGIGFYALRQSQIKKIFNEAFWSEYGTPYDQNGKIIQRADKVVWIDPETGNMDEYEVYDYPTESMVKLWSEHGECEAFPEECIVLK